LYPEANDTAGVVVPAEDSSDDEADADEADAEADAALDADSEAEAGVVVPGVGVVDGVVVTAAFCRSASS
jgi:hypothetical protein